jgi:hypothetical protein
MNNWETHKGYVESTNLTTLLDTIVDFNDSYEELLITKDFFEPHSLDNRYIQSGPLRECKSLHLINTHHRADSNKFNHTFTLLERLSRLVDPTDSKIITRAYVTVLGPNMKIYAHSDTNGEYWNTINRYQFYYTGCDKIIQIINNQIFPVGPGYFYYFDHKQIHEYYNNSDEDLILMVFDLKNKG